MKLDAFIEIIADRLGVYGSDNTDHVCMFDGGGIPVCKNRNCFSITFEKIVRDEIEKNIHIEIGKKVLDILEKKGK